MYVGFPAEYRSISLVGPTTDKALCCMMEARAQRQASYRGPRAKRLAAFTVRSRASA